MANIPDDKPCSHGRWKNRAVTVDAVCVHKGKILLMKRKEDPFAGYWALPGGYLEFGQTLVVAALAEMWQEARIRGRKPRLVGIFDEPSRHPEQAISIAYAFEVVGDTGPSVGDPKEVEAVEWWDLRKLPRLAFDHHKIIARYLTMR